MTSAGRIKLRELLSQPGILFDAQQADGTSALYRAGLAGNADAFRQLLDDGANVNNRNNDNRWTILICAVAGNHLAIAEQALRRPGIEINAADDIGNTALHLAAERGVVLMAELLLEQADIQINPKNHMGWTALAKAAFAGHQEVVKRLLARPELEVNFADQNRQTPLFHAASAGNLETARLLVADPRTNTAFSNRPSRHTALDMAAAVGFTAIAELIRGRTGDADHLSPRDPYVERVAPHPGDGKLQKTLTQL